MNAGLFLKRWFLGAMCAVAWAVSPAAEGSEVLRPSLAKLAAAVAQIVKSRNIESVTVGQFTGPPTLGSNAGPGISQVLTDELKTLGLKIKKFGAGLGVQGEYQYVSAEEKPDFKQIRLKVVLTDGSGQPLSKLNQEVSIDGADGLSDDRFPIPGPDLPPGLDNDKIIVRGGEISLDTFTGGEEAAALLGVTWDFERSGLGFDVNKDIVADSFRAPTASITGGTAVRSSRSSPYFMEIMVANRSLPLRLEDGQPVVDLELGQTFTVRITNRAKHDVSATLSLDGVNSFAFSKERKENGERLSRLVIERNKWQIVKGWHNTFNSTTEFKMAPLGSGQTAHELVGGESGLGMITAVIRSSWKYNEDAPEDEPGQDRGGFVEGSNFGAATLGSVGSANLGSTNTAGSPPPAVGFGNKVKTETHLAKGRQMGVVRSIITLRYDKPPGGESGGNVESSQ